uniref:PNP_UDP_1 domain-containing protein n=1 Tax=Steinernema glaseri TaxID=37863 RepID=A0A1I7ZZX9_9BILA
MVTGIVHTCNPHLEGAADDHLYHFGISRGSTDIPATFGDVKFVCAGGSASRMAMYAKLFATEAKLPLSENLSKSDRFCMYKTGPVLWVNHGMGTPSLSIMLIEVIKLLNYSGASDVIFVRIGTSGGIGVNPGTVIVSSGVINGMLEECYVQHIMGKRVERATKVDQKLGGELVETAKDLGIPVDTGVTLCADDFYEGQGRLDGAFCEYTTDEKFAFLRMLRSEKNVRNFEMESTCFAAMTHRAGVKAAIVCVALLNREEGDQVKISHDEYLEFEMRPFRLVTAYIKNRI